MLVIYFDKGRGYQVTNYCKSVLLKLSTDVEIYKKEIVLFENSFL